MRLLPGVLPSMRHRSPVAGRTVSPGRRRARLGAAVAAALAVLLAGCTSGHDAAVYGGSFTFVSPGGKTEFSYPADQRQKLSELSGPDLTGDKTIALSDYLGKVVVINFWGSWCPPCRAEAGDLQAASQALTDHGVQFLGINVKDGEGDGAAFNASKGVTYPSIFDPGMRTLLSLRGFPTSAIPSTIVVDREGRVAHIWLDTVDEQKVVDAVTPIAAET